MIHIHASLDEGSDKLNAVRITLSRVKYHRHVLHTCTAPQDNPLIRDRVAQGQPFAVMGKSGNATGEHCHFEIRKDRVPVDPLRYLASERR